MASHFNEIHLLLEQNDRDVDLIRRLRKGLLNGSSSPRKLSCLCYNLCFMIKFHFKTLSNKLHLGLNQLNYQHNNKSNKIEYQNMLFAFLSSSHLLIKDIISYFFAQIEVERVKESPPVIV